LDPIFAPKSVAVIGASQTRESVGRGLGDDPHTRSILLYMDSVGDAGAFLSAAREVALTKPIIAIKVGHTEAAAKAAASHTGAPTGSDDVLDAAFRRVRVLRVASRLRSRQGPPGRSDCYFHSWKHRPETCPDRHHRGICGGHYAPPSAERAQSRWSAAKRATPLRRAAGDKIENAIHCGGFDDLLAPTQFSAAAFRFHAR
jgi:hypothetical protein